MVVNYKKRHAHNWQQLHNLKKITANIHYRL